MIKLIKSSFYNEEEVKKKLCRFIVGAKMLGMSKECKKFEEGFAKKQRRKYAVFVNNGSSANLILIQVLLNTGKLKKDDVIGISAITWSTSIMPLIQLGLRPFLIDCEIDSLNISKRTVLDALKIQPSIKGIFITNVLGFSDNIKEIADLCSKKDILFFEDNCESLGSVVGGKLLGNFGIASTFSFNVGKHLSTIEGGMICTDNKELYHALFITRSHGLDTHLPEKEQKRIRKLHKVGDFFSKYTFYDLGYNARPTEINGFIGNIQLKYWDTIVEKRHKNFIFLHEAIKENNDLIPIRFNHMDVVSNFAIPVITKKEGIIDVYRNKFVKNNVEIRPMIAGNMAEQPFFKKYVGKSRNQENAKYIHNNSFYFGNDPELTDGELYFLRELIKKRN